MKRASHNRCGASICKKMKMEREKLKILFLPAWYPSEVNSVEGIFIKEHAKAASFYNEVVVLYAYAVPTLKPERFFCISEDLEEGIRTLRVRYAGVLIRLGAQFSKMMERLNEGDGKSTGLRRKSMAILIKVAGLPFFLIGHLIYYLSIFAGFRKLIKGGWRPDIIHAHIFSAGVPAIILSKIYKVPVLITEQWSAFPLRRLTLFDKLKAKFAMNMADSILPVSNSLKKAIEAYGVRNEFRIVPNTINTQIFYPSSHQAQGDRKKILFVGLLRPIKGIPYLLQSLAQLKQKRRDFVLDIVGDGPDRKEYEELTEELGLEEMVKFHGLKTKQEIAEFMRNCDFFVLPSLWENLPCVLIEAMSCGVPVVATDVGGIKELINREVGVGMPPRDIGALTKAIEYMLDNYQSYLPEKVAQYAREKFCYERVGVALDKVYRKVAIS